MSTPDHIVWELRGIRKTFGPVVANDDVSLALRRGQIHGLVGENGSGKSTLIKTLCGAHQPDAGSILHEGHPVRLDSPLAARALGIATVFQEFSLVPHMSVAENIFLGRWLGRSGRVDWRGMREAASRVLATFGIDIPPDALIRDLPVAQQQLAEIAKAMAANASVIILDEPTTALGLRETEHLHALLRRMRDGGAAILYISHRRCATAVWSARQAKRRSMSPASSRA
jgi:ABC-type sugar transport system ATPase subunit